MIAFKTELDPNNKQVTILLQHVGAARWAYNWGLDQIKKAAADVEAVTKRSLVGIGERQVSRPVRRA